MERCAVFVDASWFLSGAAEALTGRGIRRSIECDYAGLTQSLGELAARSTQLPLLRLYWYDAAPGGIPGREHAAISVLRDVKLRLARLSRSEQGAVHSLLVLDLTTLARERAIGGAVVFTGDDVVMDGIAAAQSLGVRVTLGCLGLPEHRPCQVETLLAEADDQLVVERALLERSVRVREVEPELLGARQGPFDAATLESRPQPLHVGVPNASHVQDPRQFGMLFGSRYADTLDDGKLREVQRDAPELPAEVAAQLFRDAEQAFGPLRGRMEIRRELRMGFWDHVMRRRN
jgi:uncharacterized LabA/DUF88 family protein